MTETARDIEFERTLSEWVKAALTRGVRSFPDLVAALPGAYPTEVARAVAGLTDSMPIGWNDRPRAHATQSAVAESWPVEHPLDFDWRFTAEASALLLERCGTDLPLAFLGAPTLARAAARQGRRCGITLVDRNSAVVAAVRASCPGFTSSCIDLVYGEPVAPGDAAATVADPPWYPEHTVAFLWAAARLTRVGGRVFLSLPPEGTRPGIRAERAGVIRSAASFGLQLAEIEPHALAYRMPPFEHNALMAAGLSTVPEDWRRGDLATFAVAAKDDSPRPTAPGESIDWDEEAIGSVRIKCRRCPDVGFRDPTLTRHVAGDMLTSVSRRDPARAAVDVWTSGNRVFRCAGPALFRVILSSLARGRDAEHDVASEMGRGLTDSEAALVCQAAEQATDLVRREEWELVEYGYRRRERDLVKTV
jgi:hypothetical protein